AFRPGLYFVTGVTIVGARVAIGPLLVAGRATREPVPEAAPELVG
ncbi:hypothetical protein IU487_36510, partial [Nocardia puris]|nr:hypothetical protein [Nocardia puris]